MAEMQRITSSISLRIEERFRWSAHRSSRSSCKTGALPTELRPRVYLRKHQTTTLHTAPSANNSTAPNRWSRDARRGQRALSTGQNVGDVRRMVASFKRHLRAGNVSERTIQTYLEACGLLECLNRIGSADPMSTVAARRFLSTSRRHESSKSVGGQSSPAGSIPVRLRYLKASSDQRRPPSQARSGRGKDPIRALGPRLPHKSFGVPSGRRRTSLLTPAG